MMLNVKSFSSFCFLALVSIQVYAQTKKDTITPEKLIITKQYDPTVNDAFKIKKQPKVDQDLLTTPTTLSYSILKVPVASTFSPAKGKIGRLRLQPDNTDAFSNYAKVGAGNFTSFLADFYSELEINNYQKLNVNLSHFSSQGGIDEVKFDDNFATNALQLTFSSEEKEFLWQLHGGLNYNAYNYYGVQEDFINLFTEGVGDLSQHYLGFNVGGGLKFYDAAFKQLLVDFSTFSDKFDSSENRLVLQPQVNFTISDQLVENKFALDYLSGEFMNQTLNEYAYAWMASSYHPTIQINEDRFSIKLGAEFTYLSDLENDNGDFYIYPKLEGSYRINQDNLIAFGGVDGGLDQNSYQNFSQLNPFIVPISFNAPTNRQYDAFLGLKGGSYGLSYSGKVSFTSQDNNPFFVFSNSISSENPQAFNYANAFEIAYDDLTTTAFDVEVEYNMSNQFNLGLHANYSIYNTSNLPEAFNLPTTSATLYANYKLNNKWSLQGSLFYIGERKDLRNLPPLFPISQQEVVSVSSFVDANFSIQYKINSQLHAFIDAKNLFGGNYQRWLNYPVQDLQVLGGVSFQFDW